MEIVTIDAETFDNMLTKFENFVKKTESLIQKHGSRDIGDWMNNQDVCLLLQISPRNLQTIRDNGTLAFTRIQNKIFYKPCDVEAIIPSLNEMRKIVTKKGNNNNNYTLMKKQIS